MASPLVLVVHGRAGGVVPPELEDLAAQLARRRGAPVVLQALTAVHPPRLDALFGQPPTRGDGLTLVPLLLLPGGHVRHDLPAIAAGWRAAAPLARLRRLPFLGAWPTWQGALAAELGGLGPSAGLGQAAAQAPWLLHHPLEGPLPRRYLAHLEHRTGARCVATPYSAPNGDGVLSSSIPAMGAPAGLCMLPLALAANRLTDSLASLVGPPLLQRPRFRQLLLDELEALP